MALYNPTQSLSTLFELNGVAWNNGLEYCELSCINHRMFGGIKGCKESLRFVSFA